MKYGILMLDHYKQPFTDFAIFNIGCLAMVTAQENILYEMGIDKTDIVYIEFEDLRYYDGDYLLLLINAHFMPDEGNKMLFGFPPRIIPVFLSVSINDANITVNQANRLRTFAPIGCRDDKTMHAFRHCNIDAYVLGCLTATFDKRAVLPSQTKVFFVDVPHAVAKYIPNELKKDIVFVEHEFEVEKIPEGMTTMEYTAMIIDRYKKEAKLVVTSRFHGAMFALAFGIPVILVNETFTFRFSSLCNFIPFYTQESFSIINWYPEVVDIEAIKVRMKNIAKARIDEATKKYREICEQSESLEYPDSDKAGSIDYFEDAIEFIKAKWDKTDRIRYAIWGFNNNAKEIIKYLNDNYPNARLIELYDTYKKISIDGIDSTHPQNIDSNKNLFIFVTTFVAGYFAKQVFEKKAISSDSYFICMRRYVTEEDLIIK